MSQHQKELDRHFAWFEKKLPPRPAKFVSWVRKPSSIYARVPLAILLVAGEQGIQPIPFSVVTVITRVTQKPALLAITWLHRGIP